MGGSFLPEDYIEKKAENRNLAIAVFLFVVVTLGVVGAFFVTNRQWSSVKQRQQEINQQYATETKKIEQLKVLEEQKQEMLEKAEVTTALIEKVPRSILLAEMINRMPQNLTLTELNLKSKRLVEVKTKGKPEPAKTNQPRSLASARPGAKAGAEPAKPETPKPQAPRFEFKLEILGLAGADEEVADYHRALSDCPLLDRVEIMYLGDVKIEEVMMRKFRIEAALRGNADARHIEPLQVPRLPPTPGRGGMTRVLTVDPMDPTQPREVTDAARANVEGDKE
jgi:Tfp pilus assembly protein PilN